jgi:hypothetical protein
VNHWKVCCRIFKQVSWSGFAFFLPQIRIRIRSLTTGSGPYYVHKRSGSDLTRVCNIGDVTVNHWKKGWNIWKRFFTYCTVGSWWIHYFECIPCSRASKVPWWRLGPQCGEKNPEKNRGNKTKYSRNGNCFTGNGFENYRNKLSWSQMNNFLRHLKNKARSNIQKVFLVSMIFQKSKHVFFIF